MGIYKKIFLGIFLVLSVIILRGQNISYKLYTPHDGLPQSQIQCIFQDSRGYIWVGTHYGVSYFNGVKFQSITPKDGLPYPSVRQIQEDAKGNIWFYTGKWFCKYDGQKVTYDTANIRVSDYQFFIDKSNTAWCINVKDSFLYKSKDLKYWEQESDRKWNKWLRYDKKRDRLLLRDFNLFPYAYKQGKAELLSKQTGLWFQHYAVSSASIEFGTVADSIFLLEDSGLKFLQKTNNITVLDVIQRPNGKLYFTTPFGKSLYALNNKNTVDTFPLNISGTTVLFEDKDKNVWIGAEEGLVRIYPEGFTNFSKEKLQSVWSMVEDTEGGMWFGEFYSHKLLCYKDNKVIEKKIDYSFIPNVKKGDLGDFYFGGGRDKLGNLYFPSIYGIKKYDGKKFSLLTPMNKEDHNLSMNFYLNSEKNIIVSGTTGGVNVIDLKTSAAKYYGSEKGLHRTGFVLGVGKDGDGHYWLGTNQGIAKLDLSRDSITKNYIRDPNNPNRFPYYGFNSVFGDFKGNIWVGCSQGLLRYDAKGDSFKLVADTIIRSSVNALGAYKDKYLAIAASDGVYFLDLQTFYTEGGKTVVRCFNQHNGYLGIEPNQNCLYVDSEDNVWVAASDIVTKITPSELDTTPKPLMPRITAINKLPVLFNAQDEIFKVAYNLNSAVITFEAIGFERPSIAEFSYQLDDKGWSDWSDGTFAILVNLSSGTHTFKVKTRMLSTGSIVESQEAQIRFLIDIPLHREAYFPFLLGFLSIIAVGGGIVFYMRRTLYLQTVKEEEAKRQHQLEKEKQIEQEEKRIREIKYLQIRTLQAQLNPHFIFGVLQAVQTRIYQEDRDTASKLIVNLANLMRRFLESSINTDLKKLRNSEITLKQEISLLTDYVEFEQLQYSNRFDYTWEVAKDIDIENVYIPPMLIQPYVENAIKHGILYEKERRCCLNIFFRKTDDDRLVCTISDNGVGRTRAKEIQASFIKMHKSRSTEILDQRIKIMQELGHGIDVETRDNPEGGTIVELSIDM
jgi:ligand-binding sensor domain-containing protein